MGRSGAARPGLAGVKGATAASRGTPESGSAAAAAPPQREREAARRRRKAKPSPEPGKRDLDPALSRNFVGPGVCALAAAELNPKKSVNKGRLR